MRRSLTIPSALAFVTTTLGCPGPTEKACDVVLVPDAGQRTYHCADGRDCSTPTFLSDGGPSPEYQICPGLNECETLVSYDGTTMSGLC